MANTVLYKKVLVLGGSYKMEIAVVRDTSSGTFNYNSLLSKVISTTAQPITLKTPGSATNIYLYATYATITSDKVIAISVGSTYGVSSPIYPLETLTSDPTNYNYVILMNIGY